MEEPDITDVIPPQVGKRYRMRNGDVTGEIYMQNCGTNYNHTAKVNETGYPTPSILSWLKNGSSVIRWKKYPKDLIEELED